MHCYNHLNQYCYSWQELITPTETDRLFYGHPDVSVEPTGYWFNQFEQRCAFPKIRPTPRRNRCIAA